MEIQLTRGLVALIDDEDYKLVSMYKWYAGMSGGTAYARTNTYINGRRTIIRMHRIIMNACREIQVDHINHNGLDNRKENLRLCTCSQNQGNRKINERSISGFKGVSWDGRDKKWVAYITRNKRTKFIGYFSQVRDAAIAYNEEATRMFGEFAYLNPVGGENP
jgi:hypothetical protein